MGFQQGLSGLNASAKNLDVIGNNIANVSTVGFKSSRTEFADVYASATGGSNKLQAGLGVQTALVSQQFNQGSISVTGNSLDVAISGGGFFKLQLSDGTFAYTRNGQFKLDKDGFLVTSNGDVVRGRTEGVDGPIQINLDDVAATPTASTSMSFNLNSASDVPVVGVVDPADPDSYNFNTSITVYDSLGNDHVLSYYYVKEPSPPENTWTVSSYLDGEATDVASVNNLVEDSANTTSATIYPSLVDTSLVQAGSYSLSYDVDAAGLTTFTLTPPVGSSAAAIVENTLDDLNAAAETAFGINVSINNGVLPTASANTQNWTFDVVSGSTHTLTFTTSGNLLPATSKFSTLPIVVEGAEPLQISNDFLGSTQFDAKSGVNTVSQDGFPTGKLVGVYISDDGKVMGRYSNGVEEEQAELRVTSFRNPNGLVPIGNNQWIATIDAGAVTENAPGSGVAGRLQSGAVEDSNVDLTAELVNMIIAQRLYQANAQTVKTQDQILQTLVNLR